MTFWIRLLLLVGFAAWMAGWFWAFSFSFSSSFFKYHLESRLPFLLLSLLAIAVPPLSGYAVLRRFWGRSLSALGACVVHLIVTLLPLGLFRLVYASWVVLARRADRLAFEADEAMGIGIDFLLSTGVVIVGNVLLWGVLIVAGAVRKKGGNLESTSAH